MAKAERKSSVHRRVPLDLVVVPIREDGKVVGIGVHAGLWTSQALIEPAEEVPVLRRRLDQLDKDFGFDPKGHSGKALRHSVASLPRDLLLTIDYEFGSPPGDDGDVARGPAAPGACCRCAASSRASCSPSSGCRARS